MARHSNAGRASRSSSSSRLAAPFLKSQSLRFDAEFSLGARLRCRRYRLRNGLTLLTLPDASAPVVSYHTWFRVGSRHETPGKTGLAHLFEHLMFNETSNLRAGEFDRLIEGVGGESNAATWTDWTQYYENVPASELDLIIRLEAERMANLVLRKEPLESEKEVVANERRYRVEDDVEGEAAEALYALAFRKHPYRWPTIGWMRDIRSFTLEDCRRFYRTYYAPNNAIVVLAGDFDEAQALEAIVAAYGKLKARAIPELATYHEPQQRRERYLEMRRETQSEKLLLGYRAPSFGSEDWAPLVVLNEILCGGRSARLNQLLVHELELASEVDGSIAPFHDPGLFELWVATRPGKRAREALRYVDRELRRVQTQKVSSAEIDKAVNRLELGFLQDMETAAGKAEQLGFYETVLGDAARAAEPLDDYRKVDADTLRDVARRYFQRDQRSRIDVLPKAPSARRATPKRPRGEKARS